jgi:hypothetical protein
MPSWQPSVMTDRVSRIWRSPNHCYSIPDILPSTLISPQCAHELPQDLSCFVRALLLSRAALATENLALRQQLALLDRKRPLPRLKNRDRLFWVLLSQLWSNWQSVLVIVKPETVIRWHCQGFRYYWRWKSHSKPRTRKAKILKRQSGARKRRSGRVPSQNLGQNEPQRRLWQRTGRRSGRIETRTA